MRAPETRRRPSALPDPRGTHCTTHRPIYLDRVALDFPELVIVAGHIGYPWTGEAVAAATKHVNVYIATSAWTVGRHPAQLLDWLRTRGLKVLYGCDGRTAAPKSVFGRKGSRRWRRSCVAGPGSVLPDVSGNAPALRRPAGRHIRLTTHATLPRMCASWTRHE